MNTAKRILRLRGVALIVNNPLGEVLIVQELQPKPQFGKYAGMFSHPMETSHEGESNRSAIVRLINEELPGLNEHPQVDERRRGVYRVVPGAWISLYVGHLSSSRLPTPTESSRKEVGGYAWMRPDEALTLWLRQGAYEMLSDYALNRDQVVCRFCRPPVTQAPSPSR